MAKVGKKVGIDPAKDGGSQIALCTVNDNGDVFLDGTLIGTQIDADISSWPVNWPVVETWSAPELTEADKKYLEQMKVAIDPKIFQQEYKATFALSWHESIGDAVVTKEAVSVIEKPMPQEEKNIKIDSLPEMIRHLRMAWSKKCPQLIYYVVGKVGKKRMLSSVYREIPRLVHSYISTTGSIYLDSSWTKKIEEEEKPKKGWDGVGPKPVYPAIGKKPAPVYNSRLWIHLPNVTSVYMYNWGYEIKTKNSWDLVALLSSCAETNTQKEIELASKWDIPFAEHNISNASNMIPTHFWDINEDKAGFLELFAEEDRPANRPDLGQRNFDMDME